MGDRPAWSLGRCLSELSTPGMASRWQWAITSPTSGGLGWWPTENYGETVDLSFCFPINLLLSEEYSYYHPSNMGMYSFSSNGKPLSYENFQSMIGFCGVPYVQSLATKSNYGLNIHFVGCHYNWILWGAIWGATRCYMFFFGFCLKTWRVFQLFQHPHFCPRTWAIPAMCPKDWVSRWKLNIAKGNILYCHLEQEKKQFKSIL